MTDNWTDPVDMKGLIRKMHKRLTHLERRQRVDLAAELGPGYGPTAVEITDWNSPVATLNGSYWSDIGAINSPNGALSWTGNVSARKDGSGVQQVWSTTPGSRAYYTRTYTVVAVVGVVFTDWSVAISGTGFVERSMLDPSYFDALDTAVADATSVVSGTASLLKVYTQTTPPSDPDSLDRSLQVMDLWRDSDDSNHPYVWTGTAWLDIAAAVLGSLPTQVGAAQATADGAASDAVDALDLLGGTGGPIRFQGYSSAARTALSGVAAGDTVYDTTLHLLVTHDGTNWRNQAGAVV